MLVNNNQDVMLFDTRCWTTVVEGLKYTFKELVREAVDEAVSEKMCNVNLEDKRLTVQELCDRWNISKNTLWNWEKKGVIKSLPLGRKKVYSLADIHSAEANGFIKSAC